MHSLATIKARQARAVLKEYAEAMADGATVLASRTRAANPGLFTTEGLMMMGDGMERTEDDHSRLFDAPADESPRGITRTVVEVLTAFVNDPRTSEDRLMHLGSGLLLVGLGISKAGFCPVHRTYHDHDDARAAQA